MNINYPNFEEYLGELDSFCSNRNYVLIYESENSYRASIYIEPSSDSISVCPVVVGSYKTDETYFWFEPKINFPENVHADEIDGSFTYLSSRVNDACEICQYLMEHQWLIDS